MGSFFFRPCSGTRCLWEEFRLWQDFRDLTFLYGFSTLRNTIYRRILHNITVECNSAKSPHFITCSLLGHRSISLAIELMRHTNAQMSVTWPRGLGRCINVLWKMTLSYRFDSQACECVYFGNFSCYKCKFHFI